MADNSRVFLLYLFLDMSGPIAFFPLAFIKEEGSVVLHF